VARRRVVDRVVSFWLRLLERMQRRGAATADPQGISGAPQAAPAHWVERVRLGAPGLLVPGGEAVRWRAASHPDDAGNAPLGMPQPPRVASPPVGATVTRSSSTAARLDSPPIQKRRQGGSASATTPRHNRLMALWRPVGFRARRLVSPLSALPSQASTSPRSRTVVAKEATEQAPGVAAWPGQTSDPRPAPAASHPAPIHRNRVRLLPAASVGAPESRDLSITPPVTTTPMQPGHADRGRAEVMAVSWTPEREGIACGNGTGSSADIPRPAPWPATGTPAQRQPSNVTDPDSRSGPPGRQSGGAGSPRARVTGGAAPADDNWPSLPGRWPLSRAVHDEWLRPDLLRLDAEQRLV
jgi:hypothetical protein